MPMMDKVKSIQSARCILFEAGAQVRAMRSRRRAWRRGPCPEQPRANDAHIVGTKLASIGTIGALVLTDNPIMCVILLAINANPHYPFVLAANRDEYYNRATAPAQFWQADKHIIAGRDLVAGGTWLGIRADGKFAAVTNHYTPAPNNPQLRSRGELVCTYLQSRHTALAFSRILEKVGGRYNGFGMVFGHFSQIRYQTNMGDYQADIRRGIHGLSNHFLNSPWPRVEKGKRRLREQVVGRKHLDLDPLFAILQDQDAPAHRDRQSEQRAPQPPDPSQNPIFIRAQDFGTRSSTVITVHQSGQICFEERQFSPEKNRYKAGRQFAFALPQAVR